MGKTLFILWKELWHDLVLFFTVVLLKSYSKSAVFLPNKEYIHDSWSEYLRSKLHCKEKYQVFFESNGIVSGKLLFI